MDMSDYYILKGVEPVRCNDLKEWADFRRGDGRRVALTEKQGVKVSTVFLGLDHSFGGGEPVLFETMVFGGPYDEEQKRYTTYGDALDGHREICKRAYYT